MATILLHPLQHCWGPLALSLSAGVNMLLYPGNLSSEPVTYNQHPNNIQGTWEGEKQCLQDAAHWMLLLEM